MTFYSLLPSNKENEIESIFHSFFVVLNATIILLMLEGPVGNKLSVVLFAVL